MDNIFGINYLTFIITVVLWQKKNRFVMLRNYPLLNYQLSISKLSINE